MFTVYRPTAMSELYYVTVNAKPTFPTFATEQLSFHCETDAGIFKMSKNSVFFVDQLYTEEGAAKVSCQSPDTPNRELVVMKVDAVSADVVCLGLKAGLPGVDGKPTKPLLTENMSDKKL